jgi:DNA mismatch repair protein MutS
MAMTTNQNVIALDRARVPPRPTPAVSDRAVAAYCSILFELVDDQNGDDAPAAPAFFVDLNCDQIVAAIVKGREEYNLKPFFHAGLRRADAIVYRHEVMQDLEKPTLLAYVRGFAQSMREMRDHLVQAKKLYDKEHKQAWFLSASELYCDALTSFAGGLSAIALKSRGFARFRDCLTNYVHSGAFAALSSETKALRAGLDAVRYCILIKGDRFAVRPYEHEEDYSAEVEETFAKFKQGAVKDYRVKFGDTDDMNHIEAKILEFVARLHPGVFGPLEAYCAKNAGYLDDTVAAFDREIQFYLAYLEYTAELKGVGLPFCYPAVSDKTKEVYDYGGFDIALAHKLIKQGGSVVCNDFFLRGKERILVVSGPNQGGKTTFARTFGQLHYLASLGLPVPGAKAQLFLFDRLFTHFEKQEKVENLRGKLEDDLVRVHRILDDATPRSTIIMNEIFTSTTIQDETFLSKKVMERISALDLLCVWVTFVDELASYGPQIVSMVSTVIPENPALRTFKIVRRPADGVAYAVAIAQKYRLTFDAIVERIAP